MKHIGPISCVATYDTYVATGGYDNRVILWQNDQALAMVMHDHLVNHCAFSSDGRFLVTASSDYSARIWQLPQLRLCAVLSEHDDDVDMAVFSPDNQLVASCALDRIVRVFDLSGRCLQKFYGHQGNIISLLWHTNGKQLVSSSVDGTVREWDIEQNCQQRCYDLGVRTDTIAIDIQGRIFAGDDKGRIVLIDKGVVQYHCAHQAGIKKVVLCSEQPLLATLSYDRSLAFWQLSPTGELHLQQRTLLPSVVWARAATLSKNQLICGTFGSRYARYDWPNNQWYCDAIDDKSGINALVHDGHHLYTVGDAGVVSKDGVPYSELGSLCNFLLPIGEQLFSGGQLGQLFEVHSRQVLHQHHSPLNCAALFYRYQQPYLAVGTYTGEMLIFSIAYDQSVRYMQTVSVFENAIKGITANQQQLFSVCASSDVAWHDCYSLQSIKRKHYAHEKIVNSCCTIGELGFASVSRDLTLRLWINDKVECYRTPHQNSVKSLCASPDGHLLMTGSYTGSLAGFDLIERRWCFFSRPTHTGISAITYNPITQNFVAASYDGAIHSIAIN